MSLGFHLREPGKHLYLYAIDVKGNLIEKSLVLEYMSSNTGDEGSHRTVDGIDHLTADSSGKITDNLPLSDE